MGKNVVLPQVWTALLMKDSFAYERTLTMWQGPHFVKLLWSLNEDQLRFVYHLRKDRWLQKLVKYNIVGEQKTTQVIKYEWGPSLSAEPQVFVQQDDWLIS